MTANEIRQILRCYNTIFPHLNIYSDLMWPCHYTAGVVMLKKKKYPSCNSCFFKYVLIGKGAITRRLAHFFAGQHIWFMAVQYIYIDLYNFWRQCWLLYQQFRVPGMTRRRLQSLVVAGEARQM